jgi:hypothetical protein
MLKDGSRMMTATKNAGEELDEDFKEHQPSLFAPIHPTLQKDSPKERKKSPISRRD